MLKIDYVNRWDSSGNELIEMLKKKGIEYKLVFKDLEVFKLTNIGIAGGKRFNIIEYVRPSNGQRTLVANGGFGYGDWAMEEVYLFDLEDDQTYTAEEVTEAIRDYIIQEEKKEEKEERERTEIRNLIRDEIKEVSRTFRGHTFKKDFDITGKFHPIKTSILDIIKQRLDDREVEPESLEVSYMKTTRGENCILVEAKFNIIGQVTCFSMHLDFEIDEDEICITDAR